uniref:WPP domain-interacting tail-anchored protein 1 n=1 Tax=Anthurium amnicola TaxID=1678845 RepID=A0A1D1YXS7_9ARAE
MVSVQNRESMAVDDDHSDDVCVNGDILADGEKMSGTGNAREALIRIKLDLAYCSEKVLNLDHLSMHVASTLNDYEALHTENGSISPDAMKKAFEFGMLSGILDSELKEMDSFMTSLQTEIGNARQKMQLSEHFEISEMEEKLLDAAEALEQSKEQVCAIRIQSAKFERALDFKGKETWNHGDDYFPENGQFSSVNGKWKIQRMEQQRHILQMLEKSLARELDLEKKPSDSRRNEEKVNFKLHLLEHEAYCIEEPMEAIYERLFETENAADILMGTSKQLISRLQILQFNLNGSTQREKEMRSKLQESILKLSDEESALQKMKTSSATLDNSLAQQANSSRVSLKEVVDNYDITNSEAVYLWEKMNLLEEKLRESDIQLQQGQVAIETSQDQNSILHSELTKMENVVENLQEKLVIVESKAEIAEAMCAFFTETNLEFNEELSFIKANGTIKENLLESKLKESNAQLEDAKTSVEAIERQQGFLYAALSDMENLIKDLMVEFSKAESRAESAVTKCSMLTETNLELNEELVHLRGRLECLERLLHQAAEEKMATVKDIGIRTRVITDLVMKLALERERLRIQKVTTHIRIIHGVPSMNSVVRVTV